MRYTNSKIKRDKDGKRYYKPTIVPNVPIKDSDIFVYPVFGDRFDTMAYRYYGDSNLWWIIAKANGIRGKVALESGTVIRIPGNVTKVINDFQKINK